MKRLLFVFVALCCATAASTAEAGVSWDYNLAPYFGGDTSKNINNVTSVDYYASSILGVRGSTAAQGIQAGDTFQDYAVVQFTTIHTDAGIVTFPTGSSLTAQFAFSGVQLDANNYAITAIQEANFIFNPGPGSNPVQTDLSKFTTGTTVETATLGGPSGGNNSDPVAPNGAQDIALLMHDPNNFETNVDGTPLVNNLTTFLLGAVKSHNDASPPDVNGTVFGRLNDSLPGEGYATSGSPFTQVQPNSGPTVFTNQFADIFSSFGLSGSQQSPTTGAFGSDLKDINGNFNFGFQTYSTGTLTKTITPEPASSVLFLGMMAAGGCFMRRRRK